MPKYNAQERIDAFWKKADKRGTNECWKWTGCKTPSGYGKVSMDNKTLYAHRIAYLWEIGDIPTDMELDHTCRNRDCVNPRHLQVVSHRENIVRAVPHKQGGWGGGGRGRMEYCKRGHLMSESAHVSPDGKRKCRACERMRRAQLRAKKAK